MRSYTAALILAFASAMAVQAAPTSITGQALETRSQAELEARVAAADALDTRTFEYDDEEEEDDRSPVKRWIQDFVERAVTPGETFAEPEVAAASKEKRSQEELEAQVAAADALDTRTFEYDDEEEEDDRAPVKRWIQDFVERAVTPGKTFSEE